MLLNGGSPSLLIRENINALEVEPYPAREAEWKIKLRVAKGEDKNIYELYHSFLSSKNNVHNMNEQESIRTH